MLKNRIIVACVALMVVGAVAIIGVGLTSTKTQADAQKALAKPIPVEVSPVAVENLQETISAVGTIAAMKDVMVASETAGRVTQVFFKVGDPVKQSQTLVRVDDELKEIGVEQARAQLQAAETNLKKAEKDYHRTEKLFQTGDVADAELGGYRLAYHAAEAQQKSAAVALKYAQRQFEDTRIKSPISGVVASKRVEVGEMVGPGKEIANVVDLSTLKVKLSVAEDDISKLRLRQPVTLRVDSRPGEEFAGAVYTIGAKSEMPNQHTYPVEVVVANRKGQPLKVGMFARVEIRMHSAMEALTISKESLLNEDTNPSVYVVMDNVARLRPIKLGIRAGDRYQVIEGLRAGDLVISFGQKGVKDGSSVQYK